MFVFGDHGKNLEIRFLIGAIKSDLAKRSGAGRWSKIIQLGESLVENTPGVEGHLRISRMIAGGCSFVFFMWQIQRFDQMPAVFSGLAARSSKIKMRPGISAAAVL